MKPAARYARRDMSKRANRAALFSLITMREDLSAIDAAGRASLAHSYGVAPEEVARLIDAEITRRRIRDRLG